MILKDAAARILPLTNSAKTPPPKGSFRGKKKNLPRGFEYAAMVENLHFRKFQILGFSALADPLNLLRKFF